MRVLHVINSLGASGGAEHGLVREVTSLSSDVENLVVRLYEKDQLDHVLDRAGIEVIALGLRASRGGWNWPIAVQRLRRVIRGYRPDIIHSSLFSANMVSQIAGRLAGVPVLSTFTLSGDSQLLRKYQPGAASIRASVLRAIAAAAARGGGVRFRALTKDALMTNSRLLGVHPETGWVIPRAVPAPEEDNPLKTRQDLGLPIGIPLIVNVGRQSAQKGHVDLIRAFALVRADRDSHLVIIGREGDASRIIQETIRENRLEGSVTLTGYRPHVADYLRHGSVFAFSSHMEGLGTAVLEAMAAGLPVVAYDIPPVREITGNGRHARLVVPGDIENLATRILEAMEGGGPSPAIARTWVEANYSRSAIATQLEDLLRETAGLKARA